MPPKMLFHVIDKKLLNNMLTKGVDSKNRSQPKKTKKKFPKKSGKKTKGMILWIYIYRQRFLWE